MGDSATHAKSPSQFRASLHGVPPLPSRTQSSSGRTGRLVETWAKLPTCSHATSTAADLSRGIDSSQDVSSSSGFSTTHVGAVAYHRPTLSSSFDAPIRRFLNYFKCWIDFTYHARKRRRCYLLRR